MAAASGATHCEPGASQIGMTIRARLTRTIAPLTSGWLDSAAVSMLPPAAQGSMTSSSRFSSCERQRPLPRFVVRGFQRGVGKEQQAATSGGDGRVDQQPDLLGPHDRGRRLARHDRGELPPQALARLGLHRRPDRSAGQGQERLLLDPVAIVGHFQARAQRPAIDQEQVDDAPAIAPQIIDRRRSTAGNNGNRPGAPARPAAEWHPATRRSARAPGPTRARARTPARSWPAGRPPAVPAAGRPATGQAAGPSERKAGGGVCRSQTVLKPNCLRKASFSPRYSIQRGKIGISLTFKTEPASLTSRGGVA